MTSVLFVLPFVAVLVLPIGIIIAVRGVLPEVQRPGMRGLLKALFVCAALFLGCLVTYPFFAGTVSALVGVVTVILLPIGTMAAAWLLLPDVQRPGMRGLLRSLFVCAVFLLGCMVALPLFGSMADARGMGEGGVAYVVDAGVPFAAALAVAAILMLFLRRPRHNSRSTTIPRD